MATLSLLVWFCVLGIAIGFRERLHLAMTSFMNLLSDRINVILTKIICICIFMFGLYLVVYGWDFTMKMYNVTLAATGWSLSVRYAVMHVSGVMICFYAILDLAGVKIERKVDEEDANKSWTTTIAVHYIIASFIGLILLRFPIALVMFLAALFTAFYLFYLDIPLSVIGQRMVLGVNSYSLLAIPFFILAGQIMSEGGLALRLINVAELTVGAIRGGLAMVNCVACMFLAIFAVQLLPMLPQ